MADDYDPAKAREYYLRTRELKGRKKADPEVSRALRKMSSDQKRATSTANSAAKKAGNTALTAANQRKMVELRGMATMRRASVRQKLEAALKRISETSKQKSDKIAADREALLEAIQRKVEDDIFDLPPIPKGLGKAAARRAAVARAKKIEAIRGQADKDLTTAREGSSKELKELSNQARFFGAINRNEARAENEKISADLKAGIQTARDNYQKLRTALAEQYK